MKNINAIGECIRRVRKKNGFTQAQFGDLIDKSQSTIYAYENGSVIPSFDTLLKISQLFGVSMGQLMGIEWNPISGKALRELYDIYISEAKEYE
ncbi:MAG: helix-turn-helix transcriptional regulator [Clostridia bacterium]|nr:helix-turn-helix transcriptional regulator [Clostridia bacterium]